MMKHKVALVGFGTVGTGVAKILFGKAEKLRVKTGLDISLARICDIDITTPRGVEVPDGVLTTMADDVLADPGISVVIELVGGTTFARQLILKALNAGKAVVTANKALLAEHGLELFRTAKEKGVPLSFEAAVGGGIPIIGSLLNGYLANEIDSIIGIVNGTCNYILTKMVSDNKSYDEALAEAQRRGYAEKDPTLDVGGGDSAHKLAILARLGFGVDFDYHDIYVEGIDGAQLYDLHCADELGYVLKLLAIGKKRGNEIELRVNPTLLPKRHPLAGVSDVFNAIWIHGDAVGDSMLYGRGAGEMPTASAVVADVMDVLLGRAGRAFEALRLVPGTTERTRVKDISEIETCYYMRFMAVDRPGVLAEISGALGRHNISIASVIQRGRGAPGEEVPIVMLTHRAHEGSLRSALEEVAACGSVSKTYLLRAEDG
jgi:homoserine dehydrogenase